jgi:hypothetical protein
MKRPHGSNRRRNWEGELAPEYRFDYAKSRPNRFARRVGKDAVVVILDPDVAEVFRDPKLVNALLRATIVATEKGRSRRAG